jgi:hypothetical protein
MENRRGKCSMCLTCSEDINEVIEGSSAARRNNRDGDRL